MLRDPARWLLQSDHSVTMASRASKIALLAASWVEWVDRSVALRWS